MKNLHVLLLMVSLLTCAGGVAIAQDYDAGLKAAQAGDFQTALKEWKPLADQGLAGAQFNLGIMYANGRGVVEDDAEAVRWYRLAADQGHRLAADQGPPSPAQPRSDVRQRRGCGGR